MWEDLKVETMKSAISLPLRQHASRGNSALLSPSATPTLHSSSTLPNSHTHTHTSFRSTDSTSSDSVVAALDQRRCLYILSLHHCAQELELSFLRQDGNKITAAVYSLVKGGQKGEGKQLEGQRNDRREMKRRCALKMPEAAPLSCILLLLLLPRCVNAACPSVCSCSESDREVDCSWRGLRTLPSGFQLNIHSLNLSHNRLADLDHVLAPYTHLRTLDVSHNRLSRMPALLPRSLWEIYASGNRIRLLEKNDTAYHWNLRLLDLSANRLERVVFINNTLPSLKALNLSCNKFWTVPTNMPRNLEMVDLSHNTLVQILPGSLDRLPRLSHFYLHANRFSTVCEGAFEKLHGLRLITLGDNPWACEDDFNIRYLLDWARHTSASVLGCLCHTGSICGDAQLARVTSGWYFASYTLAPHGRVGWEFNRLLSGVTTHYRSEEVLTGTEYTRKAPKHSSYPDESFGHGFLLTSTESLSATSLHIPTDMPVTEDLLTTGGVSTSSTRRTTTLRTRSVRRTNQKLGRNASPHNTARSMFTVSLSVLFLIITDHVM
ncbi:oligodendrocyte-myelin glycoprotein [Pangasianodon hypophthalmus]|uniref:oligodendrocyte-myelin glycoprotein n=1 Tax=Pangasianodon hypophthalmus TaxID=310915 RepID=UPI0023071271|nr:oligodendrocyte-myelin glycoprotein [Pangasianodon hypophthalmus]